MRQQKNEGYKFAFGKTFREDRHRLASNSHDRRLDAINLPVRKQRDRAFVPFFRSVVVDGLMQRRENHQRFQREKSDERKARKDTLRASERQP